jgi:hypothetical protein
MKTNQRAKRTPKVEVKRPPETIEERVHRHISDINSKITDDDIKSVKTELDIRKAPAAQPGEENNANKKQRKNSRRNKDDGQNGQEKRTNPLDRLNEGHE